jgi:hypothetical protein
MNYEWGKMGSVPVEKSEWPQRPLRIHRGPQRRKAPWLSTAFLMYSYRSKVGREGFVFPLWLSVGKFKMTLLKNE